MRVICSLNIWVKQNGVSNILFSLILKCSYNISLVKWLLFLRNFSVLRISCNKFSIISSQYKIVSKRISVLGKLLLHGCTHSAYFIKNLVAGCRKEDFISQYWCVALYDAKEFIYVCRIMFNKPSLCNFVMHG